MIVSFTAAGWSCIYQQAHALLAAELAAHWHPAHRPVPERWLGTLAAIAQHDDGQDAWAGPRGLTEAGAPAPFTLLPFSLEQATRVAEQARYQGRWRWLLMSLHLSNLYEALRGQDTQTDAFLDEQRATQEACRKGLKLSKKEAQAAYDLMQWADRLSLILCMQQLPDDERRLEIGRGPDGQTYYVRRPGTGAGGALTADPDAPVPVMVEPWPFAGAAFTVGVEVSPLSQLTFPVDAALAEALRTAPIHEQHWAFRRRA